MLDKNEAAEDRPYIEKISRAVAIVDDEVVVWGSNFNAGSEVLLNQTTVGASFANSKQPQPGSISEPPPAPQSLTFRVPHDARIGDNSVCVKNPPGFYSNLVKIHIRPN